MNSKKKIVALLVSAVIVLALTSCVSMFNAIGDASIKAYFYQEGKTPVDSSVTTDMVLTPGDIFELSFYLNDPSHFYFIPDGVKITYDARYLVAFDNIGDETISATGTMVTKTAPLMYGKNETTPSSYMSGKNNLFIVNETTPTGTTEITAILTSNGTEVSDPITVIINTQSK